VKMLRITRRILHYLILFMLVGIVATLWNHREDPEGAVGALQVAQEIDALMVFGLMALILEAIYRWRLRRRLVQPE